MPHPECKSTPTFSDFPLLLAPWPREIFKTEDPRLQKIYHRFRYGCADLLSEGSPTLSKVLVQIVLGNFEKSAPEPWRCPKKVPKKIFDADFGGFAGILRLWSKLQKVIILGVLRDGFEILEKSLTFFEILEKPHIAPWSRP